MFAWFKKLFPQVPPPVASSRIAALVKETHQALEFFTISKVEFGAAMTAGDITTDALLYIDDGQERRRAIVGMLLKTKWLSEHRWGYYMAQEKFAMRIEHWYITGEILS